MKSKTTNSKNLSGFLPISRDFLEEISKKLNEINVFLTGSIALYYQGIDLERKPHDIDFVYAGDTFDEIEKVLMGFGIDDIEEDRESNYDNDSYITGFYVGDVFCEIRSGSDIKTRRVNDILMQEYEQIIDAKIKYALDNTSTAIKHEKDLETIGIDFYKYKTTFYVLQSAKKEFETQKRNLYNLKNEKMINQIDFNAERIRYGQVAPYKDSVYEYIIESDSNIETVEKIARDRILEFGQIENKGCDFSGSCSFPFGLNGFYSLKKIKEPGGVFRLLICHPYTG